MGFLWVKEIYVGREGSLRDGLQRSFTRKFRVKTDDRRVGPLHVIFAPGIPLLYSSYFSYELSELDLFAICRDVRAVQDENDWQVWDITCEYDTQSNSEYGNIAGQPGNIGQPGAGGGTGASGDPTQEPPTIEWGAETVELAVIKDRTGEPIVNTAGQPFDPPPTIKIAYPVLRYSRNEATYDHVEKSKFSYALNTAKFLGYDAGRVLCKPITATQRYIGPFKYWRVNYEFHFTKELEPGVDTAEMIGVLSWRLWLLNQGLCELKTVSVLGVPVKYLTPILGANGEPISTPVPLDEDGAAMPKEDIEDEVFYRSFVVYKSIDFGPLDIVL